MDCSRSLGNGTRQCSGFALQGFVAALSSYLPIYTLSPHQSGICLLSHGDLGQVQGHVLQHRGDGVSMISGEKGHDHRRRSGDKDHEHY